MLIDMVFYISLVMLYVVRSGSRLLLIFMVLVILGLEVFGVVEFFSDERFGKWVVMIFVMYV